MRTRDFFFGIILILFVGALAWLVLRSGPSTEPVQPRPSTLEPPAVARPADENDVLSNAQPDSSAIVAVGAAAPDFELETLQGDVFRLSEQRGRVVLLNFWATWCAPCREEMPDLVMLADSLPDLVVAGVSLDEEGREIVAEFHETFPVDYPLLLDGLDVARRYGAHFVVPTTYVVDRDGDVVERYFGAVTIEEVLPALRRRVRADT